MRNRYYDPATGQFTQPDPIRLGGGLNEYGFADGDPVSYGDPYGLCPPLLDCLVNLYHSRYSFGDVLHMLGHVQRANISTHDRRVLVIVFQTVREANRLFLERAEIGVYGDNQLNAFRHQFGACTLSRALGADEARAITNAHEVKARPKDATEQADSEADAQNNAIGIAAGTKTGPTQRTCEGIADQNMWSGNYGSPSP